jgi:hypothetical protein
MEKDTEKWQKGSHFSICHTNEKLKILLLIKKLEIFFFEISLLGNFLATFFVKASDYQFKIE